MGLAVLSLSFVEEMDVVAKAVINNEDMINKMKTDLHKDWEKV